MNIARLPTQSPMAEVLSVVIERTMLIVRDYEVASIVAGSVTTVDTLVAQIEVRMRYQSAARDQKNEFVADSILVRVYPRN